MLKTRILSAIVVLSLIIPAIWYHLALTQLIVLIASWICLWEFFTIASKDLNPLEENIPLALGILFSGYLAFFFPNFFFPLLSGCIFILFIWFLFMEKNLSLIPHSLGIVVLGLFYISFFLMHFVLIRKMENGALIVFLVLVSTYMGDSSAYFTGRRLGKKALFPEISPGKTWEGFYGQILGALFGSIIFSGLFLKSHLILQDAIWIGMICGLLGALGDLCESMFKRAYDVKDSGTIMPGHGGLLDRIDGLLFTAPAVYYYLIYVH